VTPDGEIIARLRTLGHGPRGPFPPVDLAAVRAAEQRLGLAFPRLLVLIWTEVANGGVGPGYGLFGVEGGMPDDLLDLTLPDSFLTYRDEPEWLERAGADAAHALLPICDWGCGMFSAVDCRRPEGRMVYFNDRGVGHAHGVSFATWLADWLAGVDVGKPDYRGGDSSLRA